MTERKLYLHNKFSIIVGSITKCLGFPDQKGGWCEPSNLLRSNVDGLGSKMDGLLSKRGKTRRFEGIKLDVIQWAVKQTENKRYGKDKTRK